MRRADSLAALALGLALAVGAAVPAAASTDLSDTGAVALAEAAACSEQADNFLAVIVVDQSGSLQWTDPEGKRVGAIDTALDSLATLSEQAGDSLNVEATLATFGTQYEELVSWGAVTGSHGDSLRSAVERQLPTRNTDNLTDYRVALTGSKASLDRREGQLDGESCRMVLWFTDGKLDADGDGGEGPESQQAIQDLCSPQGIVDNMRASNTPVLGLALFSEGTPSSPSEEDRRLLRAIVEGSAGGAECGTVPIPDEWSPGAYLRASDADALRSVFAQAGTLIEGGVLDSATGCPGPLCSGGVLSVPIDVGVSRVRIVADSELPGTATLTGPDGLSVPLDSGEASLSGADARVARSPGLSTIEVAVVDPIDASGTWAIDFDSTAVEASVYYFWDAALEIAVPEDGLVIGETTDVPIQIVMASGRAVEPDALATLGLEVEARGAQAEVAVGSEGESVIRVSVAADGVPTEVVINASASAVTDPSGISLGPIYGRATAATVLPPSYPSVLTSELSFPDLLGTEPSTAELVMLGSERGASEVCFASGEFKAPERAEGLALTPTNYCVEVPAGEELAVPFDLGADVGADGRVDGTVEIAMSGVDADAPITVVVPVSASMVRPVDETVRWALVAVLIALALGVAVATALIGRHFADRYRFGPGAQYCAVDVEVRDGAIRRMPDTGGALLDPIDDFSRLGAMGAGLTAAKKDVAGLRFARRMPLNPWQAARAVVSASGRVVAFGPNAAMATPDGSRAPVEFPGTTGFVLSAAPGDISHDRMTAKLVMIVDAPDGVSSALRDRLDEINTADWHDALSRFADAAGQHEVSTGDGPGAVAVAPVSAQRAADASTEDAPARSWLDDERSSSAPGDHADWWGDEQDKSTSRRSLFRRRAGKSKEPQSGPDETTTRPDEPPSRRDDLDAPPDFLS